MSASFATRSSARCIAPRIPSATIDAVQFDPFHSPWAPANSPSGQPEQVPGELPPSPRPVEAPAADTSVPPPSDVSDLRGAVNAYERSLLEEALARSRFNQRATATALGLSYDQLRHALKRHKLLDAAPAN